jgi:hypothetical protein
MVPIYVYPFFFHFSVGLLNDRSALKLEMWDTIGFAAEFNEIESNLQITSHQGHVHRISRRGSGADIPPRPPPVSVHCPPSECPAGTRGCSGSNLSFRLPAFGFLPQAEGLDINHALQAVYHPASDVIVGKGHRNCPWLTPLGLGKFDICKTPKNIFKHRNEKLFPPKTAV